MKPSQCEMIVDYMEKYGSITQLEAYVEIGCMRLPSRIHDLRKKGYAIKVETVRVKKKKSDGFAPIAKYSLLEENNADNRM